ncbi:MAG: GntR family transcriptional regulator [Candidatus Binatus sp.]|uniref:GntR family transcriptional regulator n=2 Tax=Candidatus Binatus sp. TaxID=2811406 RepID=UPI003BE9C108
MSRRGLHTEARQTEPSVVQVKRESGESALWRCLEMKVRRSGTTVDELYETLRDHIIEGKYHPGFRLSQQALATELKVSRTPLREALARLAAEGLVVGEANRGMEVAPVNNHQAEQSYALRLLIEPPTIGAIVDDISKEDIESMQTILERMERTADSHRIQDFQQAHLHFHEATLRYYPDNFRGLIQSLHTKIYRHQRLYFSRPDVPESFIHVDRAFCDALCAHDAVTARQNMEFHLTDAALGLVLDVDPDHEFDALIIALRGLGIELEFDPDGKIHRPTEIRWVRSDFREMPFLCTNNLYYGPAAPDGIMMRSGKASTRSGRA